MKLIALLSTLSMADETEQNHVDDDLLKLKLNTVNFSDWDRDLEDARDKATHFVQAIRDRKYQQFSQFDPEDRKVYEGKLDHSAQDAAEEEEVEDDMTDYCDNKAITVSDDDENYQLYASVNRNCQFTQSWVRYWKSADPVAEGDELLDTEYKFAVADWSAKYGPWYQSCLPNDMYAAFWPGVSGNEPTGDEGGEARCHTAVYSGNEMISDCQCKPLSDEYKNGTLKQSDVDVIMNGNCSEGMDPDSGDCVLGAKNLAAKNKWGTGMQWLAILETLDSHMDMYTEGIHLNVEDVYYLNMHYPELLDDDCVSCQFYAANRPMPFINGVNPNFVREDMVAYGKASSTAAAVEE